MSLHRFSRSSFVRAVAFVLVPAQVLLSVPAEAFEGPGADKSSPPPPPKVKVNRTVPQVKPVPLHPVFSETPTEKEIFKARVFGEPLVPAAPTTPEENRALAMAVSTYLRTGQLEAPGSLEEFLEQHPDSPWRISLLMNTGVAWYRRHFYSRAERALQAAWDLGKESTEPNVRATAEKALGELLELHMTFGHVEDIERLLAETEGREIVGGAAENVSHAHQAVNVLKHHHEKALPSGPIALSRVLRRLKPGSRPNKTIESFHADHDGATLEEMRDLAKSAGLKMQMVFRDPASPEPLTLPRPSLLHLRAGHFGALIDVQGDLLVLDDPLLGGEVWLSRKAFEEEASGYFLVLEGKLLPGFRKADEKEARRIRGKCQDPATERGGSRPRDEKTDCPGGGGMATYSFHKLLVSLHIEDTPVGYTPPRGPSVNFTVNYNQREAYQPAIFTFSNLSPRWTSNWLSYLEDSPSNAFAPVNHQLRGGGRDTYSGSDGTTYAPQVESRAVLVRTASSPIRYELRLADGSVEVYTQPDGALTTPRRVFLTEVKDPQGNALQLTYDQDLRLVSVQDALGQVTTFSYDLATDPLKITKVTDPFGREAKLDYDASGRLIRITDVIGITSEFTYGTGDFVTSLTTPYGTTMFTSWKPSWVGSVEHVRALEAQDPLGGVERIVWHTVGPLADSDPANTVPTGLADHNVGLSAHNTYYWDKRAWALYPGDYSKATITHWLMSQGTATVSGQVQSEKKPLENRVWYFQEGELNTNGVGTYGRPTMIGRVLDDGTSQITRMEYSALGKVIRSTDPVGRTTIYNYAANGIDLLEVRQVNGQTTDLLASYTYNDKHEILTSTDAAGQTTTYTNNAQGQPLTVTTPARAGITENRTTTYAYDANGFLQSVTGPVAGVTLGYTYDGYGRVRTFTDADNHTTTYDYDALDRLTKATYPDGTFDETRYNRLDAEQQRDRLGRWTHTFYDALRRPMAARDPADRTTMYEWCTCGSLDKQIDPNNNATTWERDLQGRVTREVRADNSATAFIYENTTSRLKQATDAKGQITQLTYFVDNNLQRVTYTNAAVATPSVSFTYDPVYDRPRTIAGGTGTTTFGYNAITVPPALGAGRVATVDGPLTKDTVTYTYDELGRGASRSVNAATLSQTYDTLGRISAETNALGSFAFGYDGVTDRVATVSYPNGQTTTFSYFDNAGDRRLQEIDNKLPGAATLSKFGYIYDPTSNITAWTQQLDANPTKVYEFGYDSADELLSATLKTQGPNPTVLKRYRYGYDKAGNRSAEQVDDSVLGGTYNGLNQLTGLQPGGALRFAGTVSEAGTVTVGRQPAQVAADNTFKGTVTVSSGTSTVALAATDASGNTRTNTYQVSQSGAARSLTYDLNGNVTADGPRTYEWDAANRLVAVNQGTRRSEFTYDGLSRRVRAIEKDNGTVTSDRRYVWCDSSICEERDSAGSSVLKRFFTLGVQEGGVAYFYTKDHLGSVRELTDSAGVIRARYDYDPYGRPTKLAGDKDSFFGFSGLVSHTATGLALAQYRGYDPDTARWLSPDPLGFADGTNLYAYVHANPVGLTDPQGLLSGTLFGAAAAAAGGIAVSPAVAAGVIVATVVVAGVVVYKLVYDDPVTQTQASADKSGSGAESAGKGQSAEAARQKQRQYEAYKRRCNEPPPPGLKGCDLLRWKLQRNKDCRRMRVDWDNKWMPGRHKTSIEDLDRSIKNLEDCIQKCK